MAQVRVKIRKKSLQRACFVLASPAGRAFKIQKLNPQLFHNKELRCAKDVQNKFFSCASSMQIKTSIRWKRNS
jgi:hypothetical protein